MIPKPGEYRQLFLDALAALEMEGNDDDTLALIVHYRALLRNPEYKFGKITEHGGSSFVSSELFLRS